MHPSGSGDEVGVIDHGGNHEEVNSASHVLATSRLHLPVNVCQEGKKCTIQKVWNRARI